MRQYRHWNRTIGRCVRTVADLPIDVSESAWATRDDGFGVPDEAGTSWSAVEADKA